MAKDFASQFMAFIDRTIATVNDNGRVTFKVRGLVGSHPTRTAARLAAMEAATKTVARMLYMMKEAERHASNGSRSRND